MESRILVIDNDSQRAQTLAAILRYIDLFPLLANADAGIAQRQPQDALAIFALGIEDWSAMARYVETLKRDRHHAPLVVLTEQHERACAAFGLDASACFALDYPVRQTQLGDILRRAGLLRQTQPVAVSRGPAGPTGNSLPVRRVRRMIEQVAAFDTTVLVTGESGTGKEVVARAIHERSARRDRPFVAVNCGAIPSELLESELFGHEKGAFTGAISARKGRFEMADGGTLFLDEIGDMSLPMQVKILRVLQERTYERVGSNSSLRCDVRIIAATHRNLEDSIVKGSFREDLFYRLNVFPIETPPLRERIEDLPLLIQDLVSALERNGHGGVTLGADAINALRAYAWPGNVRELSNLVERLSVLHPRGTVQAVDLPPRYRTHLALPAAADRTSPYAELPLPPAVQAVPSVASVSGEDADAPLLPEGVDLKDHIAAIEIGLIRRALQQSNGVVAHAAKLLNARRTTLVEKLRKYGLQRELPEDEQLSA